MFRQPSCEYSGPMSFGQGGCNPNQGLEGYYGSMPSQWADLERSPYGAVSHPYNEPPTAYQAPAILTPISLPDTSYAHHRTSPGINHHSQDYGYPVSESVSHHGLGIMTPFPSELTRDPNIGLGIAPSGYMIKEEAHSPQPIRKRSRQGSKQSTTTRDPPVNILPHPEGLQRLEQERRHGHNDPHPQRPRAPGRGRRDPQAEEEDAFVESLREQNLAWRVVREMFRERYNKDATEARLQMRQLRRRKDRLARWEEHDIQVLLRARDYWEHEKYKLIAEKMTEFGATTFYTAEQCEAQLECLDAQQREGEGEAYNLKQTQPAPEPQRKRRSSGSDPNPRPSRRKPKP
ncbi:hypothetical protein BJX61DRAFT_17299 [Aspergillus egyptiacus]|nr:hypothetical protein BJX61DRAFT_17299 [Aspergillus egyptiacus]